MNEHYYYLLLNLFTISVPLLRSFEPRIAYYKSFPSLAKAIALTGGFFLIWDVIFTYKGVWGFNPRYLSGIYLAELPLGEWLFFLTVPFSCVFIYRVLNYFWPKDPLEKWSGKITELIMYFSLFMCILHYEKAYTLSTFLLLGITLAFLRYKGATHLGRFYRAYAVILIPFLAVNGILTGTGIEEEVVWYNNDHNVGIRLFTIPIEDVFYGMLLILGVVTLYEWFMEKSSSKVN